MAEQGANGAGTPAAVGETQVGSASPSDPLVGRVLDSRYQIEAVLGEGGMGLVYRAVHTTLNKALAVKVLRPEVSKNEEIVARFRREAQSASSIGNQHIVDISDFGTLEDGSTYFVMEFLTGVSLTDALEKERFPCERTVHVGLQICNALGAAHEIGIVHRDLKPDNIQLIERSGDRDFVKILDFGIAKVGDGNSKLTQAGQVFGTPHYMSPEQCAGTGVDHRTDIYALGVILYEMATGQVPFDADNLMGILTKHLYENPMPPHELPPPKHAPPALEAVILKCLAKKADSRYHSMAEVARELQTVADGQTPQAVREEVDRRTTGSNTQRQPAESRPSGLTMGLGEPRLPGRRPVWPILAAVTVLCAAGGALGYVTMGSESEPPHEATPADAEESTLASDTSSAQPARQDAPDDARQVEPDEPGSTGEPTAKPEPETKAEAETEAEAKPKPTPEPPAKVTIATQPESVEVYRGTELLGNTPFELRKPDADQRIELQLRKPGYKPQTVTLSSLTADRVTVSLEKKATRSHSRRRAASRRRARREREHEKKPSDESELKGPGGLGPRSEVLDPWQ